MRILEYRVAGARLLSSLEIEEAVYPFLGEAREPEDVERARLALEKLYQSKGYTTVSVMIPEQEVKGGVVRLTVVEASVGRLRVKGAKYRSPQAIKEKAPSLAEGKVINFEQLPAEIAALNSHSDTQVTPAILPGKTPGTFDVELDVKDRIPLHASVELSNRAGPNTEPLRANVGVRATNLFQKEHAAGFNTQIAPQNTRQVKVFSGYYSFKPGAWKKTSLMFSGQFQDSDVSTLGAVNAVGRNRIFGVRLMFDLPNRERFYQGASFGVEWKKLRLKTKIASETRDNPVTYFPVSLSYNATWSRDKRVTQVDADWGAHLRGTGSGFSSFEANRYLADGAYTFLRLAVEHTEPLGRDWLLKGRATGQAANQPLLSLEQFSAGGQATVRGYLESEAVGDEGGQGTVELHSPNLAFWDLPGQRSEVRLHLFLDGAYVATRDPLPDQASYARLLSYGAGASIRLFDTFTGAVDLGLPRATQGESKAGEWRVTFRAGLDY